MFDAMQNPNKNGVNVLPPSNIHVVSSKCEFLARSRSSCLVLKLSFAIDLICEFLKKAQSGVQCSRKAQQGVT
jgi:hypothetical protein